MEGVKKALPPGVACCPGCVARDRRIAKLAARVEELEGEVRKLTAESGGLRAKVGALEAVNARLEERLKLNSRNSSKPPSTDPPGSTPKLKKAPTGRKRGGQPGHEGTTRKLLPIEKVDDVIVHRPTKCERCLAPLPAEPVAGEPEPRRHQVWEIPEKPCLVTEHQGHACTCPDCGHVTQADIPADVASSCFGPKLTATAAALTGAFQLSRRQVEEVFEDVLGVPISVGTISNIEKETSAALGSPYQEAAEYVRAAATKNLDETGWKKKGKRCWLWVAATPFVAFFVVHPSRGKKGFRALIGRVLKGIFTTDRWHVYAERACRARQACWSHLQRDFQKLVDRGGASKRIGARAKQIAQDVFVVWKDFKTGGIERETLAACLRPIQRRFEALMREGTSVTHKKTARFCQNLLDLGPALWTFAHVEGVEPTNNHAERVIRRAVIWRKRSFGADSEDGCRFVERIMTAVMSRRLQKLPVLAFVEETIRAHRSGQQAPSLLPE